MSNFENVKGALGEYEVSVNVTGRFRAVVKARSFEEATELGEESFEKANFGELMDIDWEVGPVFCPCYF